jgi:hypothetical protein
MSQKIDAACLPAVLSGLAAFLGSRFFDHVAIFRGRQAMTLHFVAHARRRPC